jgi:hypothetical protein
VLWAIWVYNELVFGNPLTGAEGALGPRHLLSHRLLLAHALHKIEMLFKDFKDMKS